MDPIDRSTPCDGGIILEHQMRMQWPHASMTRDEFIAHNKGALLHRDFSVGKKGEGAYTFVGEFAHARSRQDAPAGWPRDMPYNTNNCGNFLVVPPGLHAEREPPETVVPMSRWPVSFRWQTFRGRELDEHKLLEFGPPPQPSPPEMQWQKDLHKAFPRLTSAAPLRHGGGVGRYRHKDKEALHLQRSSERWAARLAAREDLPPSPWGR